MAKQIHQLTTASSVGASDYLAKDTGSVTNKVTTSQIANFVVGTYTTLVAGATQTIKAAINAIKTQLNTLQNHTGLTSISGSGKSTISELLGNTSIASIGSGTVTGALNTLSSDISSLNSDLANITNRTSATLGSGLSGTAYYTRVGNIVVVTGTITSSDTIAQGATLASGFPRPATGTNFPIHMANNNAVASIFRSYITANGVLMCAENTVSNVSLRFSTAYIAS